VTSKIDQIADQQTREFARNCLETKSVAELKISHSAADADPEELDEWGLAPEAWSAAMDAALHDLVDETECLFEQTLKVEEDIALGRWCASCRTPWGIATCWGRDREEARNRLHNQVMGADDAK